MSDDDDALEAAELADMQADELNDRIEALERELAAAKADFSALQHALVGDTGKSAILEAGRLRTQVEALREALERISKVKPDQLDHSIDVCIIERCAKVARAALAKEKAS